MSTSILKEPSRWGHEIYNFDRTFLSNHYYTPILSEPCPGVEEDFLRNTSILHFSPKITFPLDGGHEIYNFLSPYPTDATYQICLRLAKLF